MLRGRAEILEGGAEHDRAQELLRARYPQYRGMQLAELPVIAIRIERVTSWGDLLPAGNAVNPSGIGLGASAVERPLPASGARRRSPSRLPPARLV